MTAVLDQAAQNAGGANATVYTTKIVYTLFDSK
jgi:hypothetical protein